MSANGKILPQRLEALLPAYLEDTLGPDERRAVEEWLDSDPAATAVALEKAKAARPDPAPAPGATPQGDTGPARAGPRLFALPPAIAWATAALAIAILALHLVWPDRTPQFTGSVGVRDRALDDRPFVLVNFDEDATIGEISRSLNELGLKVVSGPTPGGLYRVGIPAETGAEYDAKSRSLESSPHVEWLVAGKRPPG